MKTTNGLALLILMTVASAPNAAATSTASFTNYQMEFRDVTADEARTVIDRTI